MRAVLLLVPALLLAAPALAAEGGEAHTAEARAHFKQGSALYKQARYREAITEFEAAYKLKPHGVLQFNIAQCYEKLGDIPLALRSYHQYLRETPDAEDKANVQAAMGNLEKRLAEKGLQQLLVYSDPPGAAVRIDGKETGKAPWSGELAPGKHQVQLALAGFEEAAREVELTERSVELDVSLHAGTTGQATPLVAPPPPAIVPPPPASSAPAEAIAANPSPTAPASEVKASSEKPRLWTWVVAGVAAASLASAIGCGVAAKSSSNSLVSSQHDKATAQSLRDAAATRSLAANVLYGIGAAAGVTGGVLFFTGRF